MEVTKKTAKRIYLIGFMGSGKSTLGPRLAEALDFDFIDLDNLIEEAEGLQISEIFKIKGEAYFRKREQEILETTASYTNTVFATGGGLPCFNDNMTSMNKLGISLYLQLSEAPLFKRLKQSTSRPLIMNMSDQELKFYIRSTLAVRSKYYQKATLIIDANQSLHDLTLDCTSILK